MGGKSGPAPPEVTGPPDNSAMMMQMMQQMMSAGAFNPPPMPEVPLPPEVERERVQDWGERTKELANKMRADFNIDQSRRRGRSSTILTSPLLDEESEANKSIIAE